MDGDLPAAKLPEEELDDALHVEEIACGGGVAHIVDDRVEAGDPLAVALHGDEAGDGGAGGLDGLHKGAVGQYRGAEPGVQDRDGLGGYEGEFLVHLQ